MLDHRKISSFGLRTAAAVAAIAGLAAASGAGAQQVSVIPAPLKVEAGSGSVPVGRGSVVQYPHGDLAAKFDAEHLADLVKRTNGLRLEVREAREGGPRGAIVLQRSTAGSAEGYELVAGDGRVVISASHDAGLYYGTVTLWQMLSATPSAEVTLPAVKIEDEPQMKWRGLMLDSARHMQSIEYIHQLVETMSLEKMNTLHWHLTDDQGWRLQIRRYPKLTSVGAYRTLASQDGATDPVTGKAYPKYGGYYSQDQVRELVKYAAARGVTIVPEIEMPGHATAALAAYPEFGTGIKPVSSAANHYGIFPSLYNVDDATFTFLENVLTEVMELFPSQYIHVGGDEAIKPEWKASPAVQAKMKELGLKDEDALQSYFIKRIDTFITAHGHRTLGWDEILQGGLAPGAAVMSWHGVKGGIDAAKQGHDAVLTPVRPLYFNYRQSDAAHEAPGRFAINSLEQVYRFDPAPPELTAAERAHILGVQANVWTEYLITDDRVSWMLYPRTAALAEVGWSAAGKRDWKSFEQRLPAELARYKALGLVFDPNVFAVRTIESLNVGKNSVNVTLVNQGAFGEIRYTTDGAAVTASSPQYTARFAAKFPTRLRAAAFEGEAMIPGSELDRTLDAGSVRRMFSQDLKLCVNDPGIAMEQDPPHGDRPVMLANYRTPCWIQRAAPMDGVSAVQVEMVTLPWVFEDGEHKSAPLTPAATAYGELEVHLDTCTGPTLVTIPFPKTATNQVVKLRGEIPATVGPHDVCFKALRSELNPLWTLNWEQLEATK
jgi:hexosaminidase